MCMHVTVRVSNFKLATSTASGGSGWFNKYFLNEIPRKPQANGTKQRQNHNT
eukprot:m.188214 g.188214  ORF g.188214 m.188214 type:complete len:52 (+) comp18519_c0_seq16:269-424(+)